MQAQVFSLSASGTGSQSYTGLNFLPKTIIFFGGSLGTNPNVVQRTFMGASDDSYNQKAHAAFGDSTGRQTDRASGKQVIITDRSGGTVVRRFEADVTSYDNPGAGVYGFTLNQTINAITPTLDGIALG